MPKFFFSPLWDCDENCLFCAKGKAPAGVKRRYTLRECLEIVGRKRREGYDELSLDGGEPTLLPYLPQIISRAFKLGYREVMLLTNASPLADPEKAGALKAAAASAGPGQSLGICVSLHSHKRAVSEALTATAGSFDRTLRGLKNLRAAGLNFGLYHLITAGNYAALPDFASFVLKKFPSVRTLTLSYIFPASHTMKNMAIYPRLSAVQPYFARAVARLEKGGVRVSLSSCGVIPLCLLAGNERLFTDTFLHDGRRARTMDSSKSEAFPYFSDAFNRRNKVKAGACRGCALAPVCGGIWKFYAEKYGTAELKPYGLKYFAALPARRGSVSVAPLAAGSYEDPLGTDLVRLLALRFGGWSKARFRGIKAGSSAAVRLKAFASGIGYSRLDFG